MKGQDILELHRSLVQTWNVKPIPHDGLTWEDLIATLARNITFLMRHDLHRLFTTCYLLDLSEERVSEALRKTSESDGARDLAELILERELRKLESRRSFRREGSVDVEAGEEPLLPEDE